MSPYFLAFEAMIYLLFIVCFIHAWREGVAVVWRLFAGILFGILLEYVTIQQLQAYSYGRFLIMLGDVPLPIGVAWGCIVYSASLFSEASNLPEWAKPVLDALFALNIDLSMDVIAIRLGFWSWSIDIHSQFFGVPYANFWAWFWVVRRELVKSEQSSLSDRYGISSLFQGQVDAIHLFPTSPVFSCVFF